jgi:hypothetical protein
MVSLFLLHLIGLEKNWVEIYDFGRKKNNVDLFDWDWSEANFLFFSDAAWFDSTSALDSECDDEFYSVYDGM